MERDGLRARYRESKKENDLWQSGIVSNSCGEVLASALPPAGYGHAATAKGDIPGGNFKPDFGFRHF